MQQLLALCFQQLQKLLLFGIQCTNHDTISSVFLFDLLQIPLQHHISMMQNNDVLTEFLDIIHLMRGENNKLSILNLFLYDFLQRLGVDRVQTGKRLIQNHDIRIAHECLCQLYLLLIPLA